MQREIIITQDGSPSLWVPGLQESYHSRFGAVQESRHVFIEAGLAPLLEKHGHINILEIGFGSGLNALLSLKTVLSANASLYYHAIEPDPLTNDEASVFLEKLGLEEAFRQTFKKLHDAPWETAIEIEQGFLLRKNQLELEKFRSEEKFHLIYFDAFSPDVQPGLWTTEIFQRLCNNLLPGGVLCTYSSKGAVRRNMLQAGFTVEKWPGPPGKREMLRGTRGIGH